MSEDTVDHADGFAMHLPGKHEPVGDDDADEHGNTHRQADEVPHAHEGHGQSGTDVGAGVAHLEVLANLTLDDAEVRPDEVQGRGDGSHDDDPDADLVGLGALGGVTDLEYLGRCHTFGVRQVRTGDQRPTQWNRVHDAEDSADRTDGQGRPVGEVIPPSDHDEAGQDEDDCRQGTGSRCHRLYDVVLLNRMILEHVQHGHGDDGRRNRCGKGKTNLEPHVRVRCCEQKGDQPAEEHSSHRQLTCTHLLSHWK